MSKTSRELFDDFIKNDWQDIFRTEIHLTKRDGSRYVPNGGYQGVQLLRKDVNAFDEAIRLWTADDAEASTDGYDRIVDGAGVHHTWEWFLIDPDRPWAKDVPREVRERIEKDLERRKAGARGRLDAHLARREREEQAADDKVIADMNARRASRGLAPLSADQERGVRENRRRQRSGAE